MICRMCRSENLYQFLDLGFMPPADEFLRQEQLRYPRAYYPLDVWMCRACGLAQLGYVVSPEILYRHDYPYEASTTRTGREHFAKFAGEAVKRFGLGGSDLVIDVGSNVGVLLSNFKANGTHRAHRREERGADAERIVQRRLGGQGEGRARPGVDDHGLQLLRAHQ
jgi:hypothetical protein